MRFSPIRVILVAVFFCLMLQARVVAMDRYVRIDIPEFSGSVIIVADLMDMGRDQILVASGSQVDVYLDGQIITSITGFPGNATALAVGDVTGNFRPELLVGTDNAGAFYIFKYDQNNWHRVGNPRYLWAPVVYLQVADITGDGWGDIVAKNANGEVQVFLSWQGEFYSFWRSASNQPVLEVLAYDLTGDAAAEVLFAYRFGYLGVLKWKESKLEIVWENFPWGSIDGVIVGQVDARGPEIMVVTNQNIFYSWAWNGREFASTRHFSHPRHGHTYRYIDNLGLMRFSDELGISLLQVRANSLATVWTIPRLLGKELYFVDERMLVHDANAQYYWLEEVSDDYLAVYINNEQQAEIPPFIFRDGQILLELTGFANLLDWTVIGQQRLFLLKGLQYIVVDPEEAFVRWNNLTIPMSSKPYRQNDRMYLPLDMFSTLGYQAVFDPSRRRLDFYPNWGWWKDTSDVSRSGS